MTVEIKGTHKYTPDEETREYIDKKMHRLNHVKEHIADLHITLEHEKNGEYNAESNIHFRWGAMGHLKIINRNVFRAIDLLFDKIVTKATKEKEKIQSH